MVVKTISFRNVWLLLLALVMGANLALYRTSFGVSILPKQTNYIVLASIFDLAIVSPILFLAWKRQWNLKYIVSSIAFGLILVRFFIPMNFLSPFKAVTLLGFVTEGLIVLLEVWVLVTLMRYLPSIVRAVKKSSLPTLFAFSTAVDSKVKDLLIIRVICAEILMFYYAIASWRQKPQLHDQSFTMYKKSSFIALQLMLIHAIVLETLAIHFWLYEKSLILSIILLVTNIYGVILFVANLQALRLNPLQVTPNGMYISLGLMKRIVIKWSDINRVIDQPDMLKEKASKGTIEFIARDLEQTYPDVILELKQPVEATLLMGFKKKYTRVTLRLDDPITFKQILKSRI